MSTSWAHYCQRHHDEIMLGMWMIILLAGVYVVGQLAREQDGLPKMIRKAKPAELDLVKQLQRAVFVPSECVPIDDREWWIAYENGEPVGFAGLRVMDDFGFLCLSGVLPDHRGKGIQRQLIRAREHYCRRKGLTAVITYTVMANPASSNNLIRTGYRLYEPDFAWKGRWVLYWRKELA